MSSLRICGPAWSILALALATAGCGKSISAPGARAQHDRSSVTALGRVIPGRAVISIGAPPGNRLFKLEVSEGKKVQAGEILAYLETYRVKMAERDVAAIALEEARARLETETAYSAALIEQNRQSVQLLEISVAREGKELKRVRSLTGALAERSLDDQQFALQSRQGELAKANAELRAAEAALARTRSLVAVGSSEAQLKSAEAQLEQTIIRAPIAGEILKVLTYPGERIGDEPILRMGNTGEMHVLAEVHETDIGAIRIGQRATITSPALPNPVAGVVEEIGVLVNKNDVLDLDPRADRDARVVEVRVKLEPDTAIARLTHLEVSARIDLAAPIAGSPAAP